MNGLRINLVLVIALMLGVNAGVHAADLDGDGVPDNVDACCNTPTGASVDATGRPIGDLDGDCDVDLADHALLAGNLTGPLPSVACPTCNDNVVNGDETDIDCGGPDCMGCADGLSCVVVSDCQSLVCTANTCQVPTCSDGVQNGGETGIDCGGPCSSCTAPIGTLCGDGSQCGTGFCVDGRCCTSPCTGTCESCDLPGSRGFCVDIPAGQDPDNECSGQLACDGAGFCRSPLGAGCGSPLACISGLCVDNRCCNEPCAGECEACDLPGSLGTCSFIPDGEDPDDECPIFQDCNGAGDCS